jgi:hypothetical protein
MEACKIRSTTHPLVHAQGLEGKEISSPSGRGRKMSLTSPLIDQAITLKISSEGPIPCRRNWDSRLNLAETGIWQCIPMPRPKLRQPSLGVESTIYGGSLDRFARV